MFRSLSQSSLSTPARSSVRGQCTPRSDRRSPMAVGDFSLSDGADARRGSQEDYEAQEARLIRSPTSSPPFSAPSLTRSPTLSATRSTRPWTRSAARHVSAPVVTRGVVSDPAIRRMDPRVRCVKASVCQRSAIAVWSYYDSPGPHSQSQLHFFAHPILPSL